MTTTKAKPAKFSKQTITIYTDKAAPVQIEAFALAGLAYHKSLNHSPGVVMDAYTVTHIASGCKIASFFRSTMCRAMIERTAKLVDWSLPTKDRLMAAMTPEKCKEFHRIRCDIKSDISL